MKILLTGSTGYIGSAVLDRLTSEGHEVTAVVRSDADDQALLRDQQASGAKARADLGWAPGRPSLVDLLREGYPSDR